MAKDEIYKFIKYVVVDDEGNVTYDDEGEAPQTFDLYDQAHDRACELIKFTPHGTFSIYGLVAEVTTISTPRTERKL